MTTESNTYTCFVCHNVYKKERTDQEAMEEAREVWGDVSQDDCEIVCDDCFKAMFASTPPPVRESR